MIEAAARLKALADPTRLRLAALLAHRGETCVCLLAAGLGEPEFKISRHLAVLRSAGCVESRREGAWIHYRLAAPKTTFERRLLACLREGLRGHPALRAMLRQVQGADCGPVRPVSRNARRTR